MESSDIRLERRQTAISDYAEKFGELPPIGIFKRVTAATLFDEGAAFDRMTEDMARAVETGIPIQNWRVYLG